MASGGEGTSSQLEEDLWRRKPGDQLLSKWDYFEAKHICLLFYLLCFSGLYIPAIERSSTWGLWLIGGCHFLEFLLKINVLRQAVEDDKADEELDETMRRGLLDHFVLTMVYGYFHWSALERVQRKKQRSV